MHNIIINNYNQLYAPRRYVMIYVGLLCVELQVACSISMHNWLQRYMLIRNEGSEVLWNGPVRQDPHLPELYIRRRSPRGSGMWQTFSTRLETA